MSAVLITYFLLFESEFINKIILAKYKYRDFFFIFPIIIRSEVIIFIIILLFHRHSFINIICYYLFIDFIERLVNNVTYMIYKGNFKRF